MNTVPLNNKKPTFTEGLIIANQAKEEAGQVLKQFIKDDPRWFTVLAYAMNPRMKMRLPEGTPPYTQGEFYEGASFASVLDAHKTMALFYNPEANKLKIEEAFIKHLDGMTEDEVKNFVAIKDKTLHTIYEYLTEEVLVGVLGWTWEQYSELKSKHS